MKPLVYWCRWHGARLRLRGRDEEAVWGELKVGDESRPFRYRFKLRQLTMTHSDGSSVTLHLDEMGVEVAAD
jgi:hypothetical protein